ncbi:16139_t:CDS:1, partial [Racocetra persica]
TTDRSIHGIKKIDIYQGFTQSDRNSKKNITTEHNTENDEKIPT